MAVDEWANIAVISGLSTLIVFFLGYWAGRGFPGLGS